jgi:protein SCO1/2
MTNSPYSSAFSGKRKLLSKVIYAAIVASTLNMTFSSNTQAQGQPRDVLKKASIEPRVGQPLPLTAEFHDHLGHMVRLNDIVGKRPLVLCLVYFECPMLCKLAADGLVRSVASVPENVGQDFDIAMISFDPRDTPERATAARKHALDQYARPETAAGWHFLTGSQENIDLLTKAVGFHYVWDQNSHQFAHAAGLMIIAPDGVVTEYMDGIHYSPRDFMSAVNRAAHNELTDRPSTSFVRCYLYDPTTGKFGAAVQWTIRVLGIGTVIAMVIAVYSLNRRAKARVEGVVR